MDFLKKTYLVCNLSVLDQLKQIEGFKIHLGQQLLNQKQEFNPGDVNIQMHVAFFQDIIQMVGFLGSLQIYTSNKQNSNSISIINEKNKIDVQLNLHNSIYEAINDGLNSMALITGYKVKTEEIKIKKEEEIYVRPDKKLEEMSISERIAFARNRK